MTKRPILVTGAGGFIGSKTIELLLADGFSVVGVDNLNEYYEQYYFKITHKMFNIHICKNKNFSL